MGSLYDIKAKAGEMNKSISSFMEFVNKMIEAGDISGADISKKQDTIKSLTVEIASLESHRAETNAAIASALSSHTNQVNSQKSDLDAMRQQATAMLNDAQKIKEEALRVQIQVNAEKEEFEKRRQAFESKFERMKELVA